MKVITLGVNEANILLEENENNDSEGKFELDKGIDVNASHIINYNVVKNNTIQYYASMNAKYINITNIDEPVWFNSSDGLSKTCMNTGCVYIISFIPHHNVTMEVARKQKIAENIDIILEKENRTLVLNNKDLTTCGSKAFIANQYPVKTLALHIVSSPESEFSIKIAQIQNESDKVPKWVFIVGYSLDFIVPIILLVGTLKCDTKSKDLSELAISNGKFSIGENKYKQTTCTICIEDFTFDSDVSIIDECKHLFHKACIVDWLIKSNFNDEYLCPFGRSEIPNKSN